MRRFLRIPLFVGLAGLAGCTTTPAPSPRAAARPTLMPISTEPVAPTPLPFFMQTGLASYYGGGEDGKTTADGESFDHHRMTAAHRTLAFGTVVRVTDLENGRTVKVRINDRGPHVKGRIIDLSAEAAAKLGMKKDGVARVKVEAFQADQGAGARHAAAGKR